MEIGVIHLKHQGTFYKKEELQQYLLNSICPVCNNEVRLRIHNDKYVNSRNVFRSPHQDFVFLVHIRCKPKLTPEIIYQMKEKLQNGKTANV